MCAATKFFRSTSRRSVRGKGNLRRTEIMNVKDRLPVAYLLLEDFFGAVLTILPEPSFKVWMVSADRLSKCSTSPLGQRPCTDSILALTPRPKCTRMSFCEI